MSSDALRRERLGWLEAGGQGVPVLVTCGGAIVSEAFPWEANVRGGWWSGGRSAGQADGPEQGSYISFVSPEDSAAC